MERQGNLSPSPPLDRKAKFASKSATPGPPLMRKAPSEFSNPCNATPPTAAAPTAKDWGSACSSSGRSPRPMEAGWNCIPPIRRPGLRFTSPACPAAKRGGRGSRRVPSAPVPLSSSPQSGPAKKEWTATLILGILPKSHAPLPDSLIRPDAAVLHQRLQACTDRYPKLRGGRSCDRGGLREARSSVQKFLDALESPKADYRYLVKVRVQADGHVEHIWLEPVSFDGTLLSGPIARAPQNHLDKDGFHRQGKAGGNFRLGDPGRGRRNLVRRFHSKGHGGPQGKKSRLMRPRAGVTGGHGKESGADKKGPDCNEPSTFSGAMPRDSSTRRLFRIQPLSQRLSQPRLRWPRRTNFLLSRGFHQTERGSRLRAFPQISCSIRRIIYCFCS